jgi:hypothetical protein
MKTKTTKTMIKSVFGAALLASLTLSTASAYESGPLVDLLVKKRLINDQEAEELRAELAQEFADTSAGKIELGSTIKGLKIGTDIRTRYQYEDVASANKDNGNERSRWRYRVKVGADYSFAAGWSAGLQLETADASDSTNADFGGYFDKNGDGLFLGQVYIDYQNRTNWADLFNFTVGKKKSPFLLGGAFWDGDINPEGFTQQAGWNLAGDHSLTLRLGEYLIDEEREDRANGAWAVQDDWLLMGQLEYNHHFGMKNDLKVAPMFLIESAGVTSTGSAEGGNVPSNENGINYFRNFFVVALPVEWKFLVNDVSQTFFATVGMNLDGDKAVNAAGSPYRPSGVAADVEIEDNNLFFNIGYKYGSAKLKGEWEAAVEYRHIEAGSYTPNLSDSDFAKNSLNAAGVVLTGKYMLSNQVALSLTYMDSQQIEDNWSSAVANKNGARLLQIDLNAKF